MAAQAIRQTQGRLQVHPAAAISLGGQGGAGQRFFTHIRLEAVGRALGHREANPIHGHAVAEGQGGWIEPRLSRHQQFHATAPTLQLPDGLHQPGEHAVPRSTLAIIGQGRLQASDG